LLDSSVFGLAFEHDRDDAYQSFAQSSGQIAFTANEYLRYEFEGSYALLGERRMRLVASIKDAETNEYIFRSDQISNSTPDDLLTIGDLGGDESNVLVGSPFGVLDAGRDYIMSYSCYISAQGSGAGRATASGNLRFAVTPVPEPTCVMLVNLGLATLIQQKRRTTR